MPHEREEPTSEPSTARYANYFEIGHNAFEFVIAFGQFHEGERRATCHTRILVNPLQALNLLHLLKESLEGYEGAFGEIRDR